jgi:hypothetical protein
MIWDCGQLLRMRLQRGNAALERFTADVHAMRCILESVRDEPPSRMWLESFVEQLWKHPPVRRVAHRIDGRQPSDAVIRLVQPLPGRLSRRGRAQTAAPNR